MVDGGCGGRVSALRLQAGWTQAQLAGRVGRTAGWVSKVERGILPLTDLRVLRQLAVALDVPVSQLLGDEVGSVGPLLGEELQRRAFLAGLGIVAVGGPGTSFLGSVAGSLAGGGSALPQR